MENAGCPICADTGCFMGRLNRKPVGNPPKAVDQSGKSWFALKDHLSCHAMLCVSFCLAIVAFGESGCDKGKSGSPAERAKSGAQTTNPDTTEGSETGLERKNRPVLIRNVSLEKGPPVRLFLETCKLGGVMASTPSAAFRMRMSLSGQLVPEFAYRSPRSEYVLTGVAVVGESMVAMADERFPALLKLTDAGELVWVAGTVVWGPLDGKQIQQARAAATVADSLRLLSSAQGMDREEGAYSLPFIANLQPSEKKAILNALAKALADESEDVRRTAAESLAKIGDRSVVTALKQCAEQDPSGWCREIAQEALESHSPGTACCAWRSTPPHAVCPIPA